MDNDTEDDGEGVNAQLAQAAAEAEERAQRAEQTAAQIAEAARESEMVRTVEERLGDIDQWRAEHEARTQGSLQALQLEMQRGREATEASIQALMELLTPPPPPEPVILEAPPPAPSPSEPATSEAVDPAEDGPRESPEAPENPVVEVARKLKRSL